MRNSIAFRLIVLCCMAPLFQGCTQKEPPKSASNKAVGTKEERIEFHKGQITRYMEALEKEEGELSKALTEQRMNDIRASNLKKQRYLIRLEQHKIKLKELEESSG